MEVYLLSKLYSSLFSFLVKLFIAMFLIKACIYIYVYQIRSILIYMTVAFLAFKLFFCVYSEILALGFDEDFIWIWEYYFDYCAAGFKALSLGVYQLHC